MARSTLGLIGLYNYDSTLFDGMSLPPLIDREVLIDNLLMELGEFEIIYPNHEYLKFAINRWSKKEVDIWNRLIDTTLYEYDPIKNFSRTDTYTALNKKDIVATKSETANVNSTISKTLDSTSTDTELRDLSKVETKELNEEASETTNDDLDSTTNHDSTTGGTSKTTTDDINTKTVSAWNQENTYSPSEKVILDGENNTVSTGEVEYETKVKDERTTSKDVDKSINEEKETKDTGSVNHNGTVRTTDVGNSNGRDEVNGRNTVSDVNDLNYTLTSEGVNGNITVQRLIEEQREVALFNVMDRIIDSFKIRFCILIY